VRNLLRNFKLDEIIKGNGPGATVITDRGSAWPSPLKAVTDRHIYDVFHFYRDIQTHTSDNSEMFKEAMRKAVFTLFDNEEELITHLDEIEKFAKAYIQKRSQ
jgi:hypothetical protein